MSLHTMLEEDMMEIYPPTLFVKYDMLKRSGVPFCGPRERYSLPRLIKYFLPSRRDLVQWGKVDFHRRHYFACILHLAQQLLVLVETHSECRQSQRFLYCAHIFVFLFIGQFDYPIFVWGANHALAQQLFFQDKLASSLSTFLVEMLSFPPLCPITLAAEKCCECRA